MYVFKCFVIVDDKTAVKWRRFQIRVLFEVRVRGVDTRIENRPDDSLSLGAVESPDRIRENGA